MRIRLNSRRKHDTSGHSTVQKDSKDKDGISKENQFKLESSGGAAGANSGGGGGRGTGPNQSTITNESCHVCGKSVANIKKHLKSHNPDKYQCSICMISLTRSDNLKRHIKLKHGISENSSSAASMLRTPYMRLDTKHFLAKSEPYFT